AASNGNLRSEYPPTPAEFVGTVLLLGRGRIRVVGAARLLVGRILGYRLFSGSGILVVFAQARLNLIKDAQIADELNAVSTHAMGLRVRIEIHRPANYVRHPGQAKRNSG